MKFAIGLKRSLIPTHFKHVVGKHLCQPTDKINIKIIINKMNKFSEHRRRSSVNFRAGEQARREPQRGPVNHYRGALSHHHSVCAKIETSRLRRQEEETWGGVSLTIRLGVWVSVVSFPSGLRPAPGRKWIYAYLRTEICHP